jgi:hypothetical protein
MGHYDDLEHTRAMWMKLVLGAQGYPLQLYPIRSEAFWNETGRVVMAYLKLRLGSQNMNKVDPTGFVYWLAHRDDKVERYSSGSDMDRAELVDEWLLENGVR